VVVIILRRVGGLVLSLVGLVFLAGPLSLMVLPQHGQGPKVLGGAAYQGTLGLFILIMGLYFLTRRPKKGPENHG
jgi:hypothetical protein